MNTSERSQEWLEVREKIAQLGVERGLGVLADFYEGLKNIPVELLDQQWEVELAFADYLLSIPDLLIKAKDQTLPPEPKFYADWGGESGKEGYGSCQQDMLNAGFEKVVEKSPVLMVRQG